MLCQILYETSSDEDEEDDEGEGKGKGGGSSPSSDSLVDVEDIGSMMKKMKSAKKRRKEEEEAVRSGAVEPREMVTPMLRKALTKQGLWHTLCITIFLKRVIFKFRFCLSRTTCKCGSYKVHCGAVCLEEYLGGEICKSSILIINAVDRLA